MLNMSATVACVAGDEEPSGKTVNQVVAWNMAALRKTAGMTQAELGEHLGWSNVVVSAAERSWHSSRTRKFDADEILAIAEAIDVPILALFVPPPETGGPDMAALLTRVLPEAAGETPVLHAYRVSLASAADRYLDPGEAGELAAYLRDMADAATRHERADGREAAERESRERLRAWLEEQLAALGPEKENR